MVVTIGISAVFWVLLTDGAPSSWLIGLPAIALTVWIVHWFPLSGKPLKIHLSLLLKFIPWFLLKSVRGGLEVSRLALSRPISLNPTLFEYECTLADTRARALFAMCLNVLPGTTTVRMDAEIIHIHSLTSVSAAHRELTELEGKISGMLVTAATKDVCSAGSDSAETSIK